MKRSVALHFARAMYVEENPLTKYLTALEKLKVKKYSLDMIPVLCQSYISQESNKIKLNSRKMITNFNNQTNELHNKTS